MADSKAVNHNNNDMAHRGVSLQTLFAPNEKRGTPNHNNNDLAHRGVSFQTLFTPNKKSGSNRSSR